MPDMTWADTTGAAPLPDCPHCLGLGWVCETHPEMPYDSGNKQDCECGGAGMICDCALPKAEGERG